ncbi:MAG: UDP-glucose 4-epimerase GalE [Methylobacter sp.]|nr:UDP-glucose 4-epimerase GalE [Methylobacter sp.]
MDKCVLIVGGAGYIGSHTNKVLTNKGYNTIVLDNLDYGHKDFVKWGEFILGDLNDIGLLRLIFNKYNIEAVMHFAAYAYVGESVENPEKYYINNVANTLNILKVMREFSCNKFIFSSSCATYGNPITIPIDENHPQVPINPYGRSKLMVENVLQDYSEAYGFKFVSLRYFNAAGADIDQEIGEQHDPETHLIPLVLEAALGKRSEIKVYGVDYETRDGSAIRDYIHVLDLAQAHLLALEYLNQGRESNIFNLSNGEGYSVLEVIDVVKKVTGKDFNVIIDKRRPGDPAILIGDSTKASQILNWKPEYFQLDTIIKSAWNWINV